MRPPELAPDAAAFAYPRATISCRQVHDSARVAQGAERCHSHKACVYGVGVCVQTQEFGSLQPLSIHEVKAIVQCLEKCNTSLQCQVHKPWALHTPPHMHAHLVLTLAPPAVLCRARCWHMNRAMCGL